MRERPAKAKTRQRFLKSLILWLTSEIYSSMNTIGGMKSGFSSLSFSTKNIKLPLLYVIKVTKINKILAYAHGLELKFPRLQVIFEPFRFCRVIFH